MDIAVLFGDKSSATVDIIKKNIDDKDIKPFNNISSFANYIRQSGTDCERILMNTNTIKGEHDLETLHEFLRQELPSTSVLFLVSAKDTSNIQQVFSNIYNLSIYTDICTQQESLQFLNECMTETVTVLRDKYSTTKETLQDDDLVLSESYGESIEQNEEEAPQEEAIIAFEYIEPLISSEEPPPVNPKDKQRLEEIQLASQENMAFAEMLVAFRQKMFQEGYFTNQHYPLNLADVDPTVLLFKQRQKEGKPRELNVFKPKLEEVKNALKPLDLLRLAYAEGGVLNFRPFYDHIYLQQPVLNGINAPQQGKKAKSKAKGKNKEPKAKKKGLLSKLFGR